MEAFTDKQIKQLRLAFKEIIDSENKQRLEKAKQEKLKLEENKKLRFAQSKAKYRPQLYSLIASIKELLECPEDLESVSDEFYNYEQWSLGMEHPQIPNQRGILEGTCHLA